jgi:hypothetical protein
MILDRHSTARPAWLLAALPLSLLGAACAGSGAPAEPAPAADSCVVVPGGTAAGVADAVPIVVAASGGVDAVHAPLPRSPAEELVFTHFYRTLVRVDCEGRVVADIARSWRGEDEGRAWTFELHPDVRDWRGDPLTAHAVAAAWSRPAGPGLAQVTVANARTLHVSVQEPVGVEHFARAELAVAAGGGEGGWPVGTGAYRPAASGAPDGRSEGDVPGGGAGALSPPAGSLRLLGPSTIDVRPIPRDARDALESGADLMVTRDPAVVEYAEASPVFSAVPLAWDRAYVLAAAGADVSALAASTEPGEGVWWMPVPAEASSALARDAVRLEARVPLPLDGRRCALPEAGAGANVSARSRRVVYPASDPVARSLAERLVALALAPERPESSWLAERAPELTSGARISAAGVDEAVFDEALRSGRDVAYVFPVARGVRSTTCDLAEAAAARAPWLQRNGGAAAGRGAAVLPLVEVRSTLVVRDGVTGVSVDGRGIPRLERIRRRAPGGGP